MHNSCLAVNRLMRSSSALTIFILGCENDLDNQIVNGLFTEKRDAGNQYREEQLKEIHEFIDMERKNADIIRTKNFIQDFSSIDAYSKSIEKYRQKFIHMLGWPLCNYSTQLEPPNAKTEFIGEDSLGRIYRMNITIVPGLTTYGILFLPKGNAPYPLIIAQHGGGGTPEICSGFFGSDNYNDMTRRVLRKGFAVFAPQLLLWKDEMGPSIDRVYIDNQLKQLGGSITALEIFKLKRSLDYLVSREDIDGSHIGMIGLSYGGFYTLFTTACDLRIKAALSSCFFNNRFVYDLRDWTWLNSGNTFLDAEVCGLICPRSLYIEVAKNDELFDIKYVQEEFKKVQATYEKLGLLNNLVFKAFEGCHELDKEDLGIEYLCNRVMNGNRVFK